jgi:hypothetical protein
LSDFGLGIDVVLGKIFSLLSNFLLFDLKFLLPLLLSGVDVHFGEGIGLTSLLTPIDKGQFKLNVTYLLAFASEMMISASFSASSRFLTLSSMFVIGLTGRGIYNNIILLVKLLIQYVNFFR